MNKYIIISPVRNEENFLPRVISSVANQTILPVEWIIVNDGSTDGTARILHEAEKKYKWITFVNKPDRGERLVGPGVVDTFNFGYERKKTQDFDFIAKMDGDIEFKSIYIEKLLQYFAKDDLLGSASGKIFFPTGDKLAEERSSDEMTCGAFNFYRRKTFEDIGGFVREVMWDGIAYHRARIAGWRTRSINDSDLDIIHKRLMGSSHKNILFGRMRWGRGQYFMGTGFLYILAVTAYRMFERPFVIGGLSILLGYILSAINRIDRYGNADFRKSLHAWQMERLNLGKRLEILPKPEKGLYSFAK